MECAKENDLERRSVNPACRRADGRAGPVGSRNVARNFRQGSVSCTEGRIDQADLRVFSAFTLLLLLSTAMRYTRLPSMTSDTSVNPQPLAYGAGEEAPTECCCQPVIHDRFYRCAFREAQHADDLGLLRSSEIRKRRSSEGRI